jgi:hypothetical protein
MLAAGRISVIQFEYNFRWIFARSYLRDALDFLDGHGYVVGKLTGEGVEWYERWRPELESFQEANYLATPRALRGNFASVTPWYEARARRHRRSHG